MLGGARAPAAAAPGSRARRICCWRTAQCYRRPGPPTAVCTAALPRPDSGGRDKEALREGPPEPHLPAVAGTYRLQDGLRGLCVFQELPLRPQPALHREYPEPVTARLGALHLLWCFLASPFGQRLSHFILRRLLVFPRFARPGPRRQSPPPTRSWSLSQSLLFSL